MSDRDAVSGAKLSMTDAESFCVACPISITHLLRYGLNNAGKSWRFSALPFLAALIFFLLSHSIDAQSLTPKLSLPFPFAQTYFESVGDSESIPSGNIMALAQDPRGFLWIGTQGGLIRYDGYRFRKFTRDINDPKSIAGNYIQSLWAAPDGKLWVGTASEGLSIFDPRTEQFTNFNHDPDQAGSISGGRIRAIVGDRQNGVWIGTETGLDYLSVGAGAFKHYRQAPDHPESLNDNKVRSLLIDREARLWVGTASGLQRLRSDGSGFENIATALSRSEMGPAIKHINTKALGGQEVMALFQAQDGKIWVATAKQGAGWIDVTDSNLSFHAIAVNSARSDSLSHAWINDIAQPQADQIWLGSYGGGINVVSASDGRVLRKIMHDPAIQSSLALDSTSHMLMDRSGLLWIGTYGGGLQRHFPANQAFHLIRHSPTLRAGLSHANVRSMLELSDGRILVGTDGKGIDILDRERGLIGGYRADLTKPMSLADSCVLALVQSSDGAIWAGTRLAGVQRLAAGSSQWQRFSTEHGLPNSPVRRLLIDKSGELWAGTNMGLHHWNAREKKFEIIHTADGEPIPAAASSLAVDAQGQVWSGGISGLWMHDAKKILRKRSYTMKNAKKVLPTMT